MFFSFLSLSLCINRVGMVDDKEFKKALKKNTYVVALVVQEQCDDFWQQTEKFSHIVDSGADAKFVVLTDVNAPKNYKKYSMGEPGIGFFFNRTILFSCPMPNTTEAINHVIRSTIMNISSTCDSIDQFYEYYNQFKYTFVCTEEMTTVARMFYMKNSYIRGPLGFCVFNKTYYESLGLKPDLLTLYRPEEGILHQFAPTEEDLSDAYVKYVDAEIYNPVSYGNRVFVVPFGNFEEKINLIEIAKKNHEGKVFGHFAPTYLPNIQPIIDAIGINSTEKPYVTCIDTQRFFAYEPLTENFTTENIVQYLNDIDAGKVKGVHPSEPIPSEQSPSGLVHLVGKTYEDFLKNDENDDYIFYGTEYDTDVVEKAENFTNYLKDNNIKGIRVAYITINNNSSPLKFPDIVMGPHTEFFPAKKHNKSKAYLGSRAAFSLLLFAKTYGSFNQEIKLTLLDREEEFKCLQNNIFAATFQPHKDFQKYADENMLLMGRMMGLGSTTKEIKKEVLDRLQRKEEEQMRREKEEFEKQMKEEGKEAEVEEEQEIPADEETKEVPNAEEEKAKKKMEKKEKKKIKKRVKKAKKSNANEEKIVNEAITDEI